MAQERTRALHRTEQVNPVAGLLDAAGPNQTTPDPLNESTESRQRQVAPPPMAPPSTTSDHGKKQVNYRMHPEQIEALRRASIVHSFRMGEKYSQNRIVEEAVQQWLDANGPWNA